MQLSKRSPGHHAPNPIALARAQLAADGVHLTDLTDTNPTHHGLLDESVLEVLARATRNARHYDPAPRGPIGAREALAAHFGGHPDEYWLTASTSEAYSYLLTVLADPGDGIAIPAPGYPLLEPLAHLGQVRLSRYWWHYVHPYGWMCDVASLAGGAPVRAIIAVNPGNPTGTYVDGATRASLVEASARAGAVLIADEVFHPFVLDPPTMTMAGTSAPGGDAGGAPVPPRLAGESAVVTCALDGLSKLLCAPQLKLGWMRLTGPRAEVEQLAAVLEHVSDTFLSVAGPIASALPDLLDRADVSVRRTRERLNANLAIARQIFGSDSYRVRSTQGGWMVLVDVPRYRSDDELLLALLRRAHLAVHPGWFYDIPSTGTLVLSLLPEAAEFRSGCERLEAACSNP